MTSSSPGVTLDPKKTSHLDINALYDATNQEALKTLQHVFQSSLGPGGRSKLIHNNCGGHVTLTSCSGRILQSLSISNPILKLVSSAIQGHLAAVSDGGSLTAALALALIQNSSQSDLHPRLLTDIYELLLQECLDCLQKDAYNCRLPLDIGSLSQMTSLVRTVIGSKSNLMLTKASLQNLSSLVLSAHLRSLPVCPRDPPGVIQYLCIDGLPAEDSHLRDGVLFEAPHIPVYRQKPLVSHVVPDPGGGRQVVRVALFNVSLSGDTGDHLQGTYEIENAVDLEKCVLDQIASTVRRLIAMNVGVVACQRVIHPRIKRQLRQHSILAIDRLGNQYIHAVHQLAGGQVIGSFNHDVTVNFLGYLTSVTHKVINGRSYIHLERKQSPVCTLILCHKMEETCNDLKYVCQVANHVLRMTMQQPWVLPGGGCWLSHLVASIKLKVRKNVTRWSTVIGCSERHLQSGTDIFTRSMLQVVMATGLPGDHMTDSTNHHHWVMPAQCNSRSDWPGTCACGMTSKQEAIKLSYIAMEKSDVHQVTNPCVPQSAGDCQLLDSYPVMLNALKIGMGAAVMVLGISNVIVDAN